MMGTMDMGITTEGEHGGEQEMDHDFSRHEQRRRYVQAENLIRLEREKRSTEMNSIPGRAFSRCMGRASKLLRCIDAS